MVDAVTLDFGGSPLADFSMPDASGLVPLSLPEAVPNGNQKPLQQPSPEAVRRFQEAMKAPVSPVTLEPLRRVAEQKSVAVETVVKHETIADGGEVETMDTPRVSRPVPQTPFTPQREMTHVVTEASPAAAEVVGTVAMPAAQATPFVDKPAMPAVSVAASVVEVPVRPLAVSVAAPVVNEPVKPVTAPVALPAIDEPVPTPIAAEMPRRAAEPQIVVVETVVRHETIDMSGEVETKEASRVSRPVPQTPFTSKRETTHVVTEASPAAAKVAGAVATPAAQATPFVDKPAMPTASVAAPVVEVPVRPVAASVATPVVDKPVIQAGPVAAPVVNEAVRPVAAPVAAPAVKETVSTPIAAEIPRRAAEPQSVVVETVVRPEAKADGGEVETIDMPRVSRPVPQSSFTPQRETTHVATEASPAATQVVGVVVTPAAQATPVVDKPVMPASPVAVPVVEVPVRPVVASVAAPVVDESVRPIVAPVTAPIAEEPVATPIAAEIPRKAAEPQSVVVETVVRHETIGTPRVSRPVPQTPFTPSREMTHVVTEASSAAAKLAEVVATPAAQATPVVDRLAMPVVSVAASVVEVPVRPLESSFAAPVVNEPVTPVAIPSATPVVDKPAMQVAPDAAPVVNEQPVAPVVIPVAAPVVEVPVRPVVVPDAASVVNEPFRPVAAPIAAPAVENPVATPIAAETPRRAAEPQSVVVETVVRHETKADGGEVETIETTQVSRSVPPSSFTPQREMTHVVTESSPAATQVVGVVVTPAAQATPVVDKPVMPAASVAVPVVEELVTPVAIPVAVPVVEVPVTPVSVPFAAPIAKEPVIMPVAPDAPRNAAEPQNVVVETVVRHETKADGREVETIETSRVSRPVPQSSFTPQRETTHVVIEASPAATQVAGAVATPAAQVTPVVDRPAIQAAPVAAPVVNEPVTPVAIPIAAPVVEVPVRPLAASVAAPVVDVPVTPVAAPIVAPVVDVPVTPVAVPVAAPIAEEPVITPVATETPRRAAEPQSVVVETVVRHETIAEGGEVETMAAPRVPRPVPQTPSTPSREATHVVAKTPDEQETVLQAAPVVAAPPEYLAASVPLREDGISVAAATARTEAIVETVNKMVEAVVGQISVTPSLVKGEGEVHMTLKPTVLDGSDITLTAKDGTLTVAITPATPEAAQSAASALPRLEAALAEHVAAFHHVSVALVAKKGKTDETA